MSYASATHIQELEKFIKKSFQIATIALQHGQKLVAMELGDLLDVPKEIVLFATQAQRQILALKYIAIVLQASEQILHIGLLGMDELLEYGMHALVALIAQLNFNLILSGKTQLIS